MCVCVSMYGSTSYLLENNVHVTINLFSSFRSNRKLHISNQPKNMIRYVNIPMTFFDYRYQTHPFSAHNIQFTCTYQGQWTLPVDTNKKHIHCVASVLKFVKMLCTYLLIGFKKVLLQNCFDSDAEWIEPTDCCWKIFRAINLTIFILLAHAVSIHFRFKFHSTHMTRIQSNLINIYTGFK